MSSTTASSASSTVGGDETDLLQSYGPAAGVAVLVILAMLFFSGGSQETEVNKKEAPAAATGPSASGSKKSKKGKKAKSIASGEEKKKKREDPPQMEEEAPPVETSTASKKKKKKKKKTASGGNSAAAGASKAQQSRDADSDSDDEDELWRFQPAAAQRKGASDVAKRAAANKEKERDRKLKEAKKEKEEQKKKEARDLAIAMEEEADAAAARAAEDAAKKQAEAGAEAKKSAETKVKNGSSTNGDVVSDSAPLEKKKRKRKKKKPVNDDVETRPGIPLPPSEERWETVPIVEEWQEVGHKKAKALANLAAKTDAEALEAEEAAAAYAPTGDEAEGDLETSVDLPAGDDPLIFIGRGGCTIQGMQENSGAKFHLDRIKNILTISGPEECVQLGLAEARSILAADAERKANEATEKVSWGSEAVKAVIGRGGVTIRSIQDATDVRIDADVEAGTLQIVGPSEQVSSALTLCHNAAYGEAQDVLELGSRNAVNVIYGPNFQTIRELQESTGCKLEMTRGTTTLKLSGSTEAVADAAARVRELLEASRGFDMTIEISKVGAVYGKGGETVRSIQDRTGVQIDVVRGPTHATVSVMGLPEATERARLMLQRAIDGEIELGPGDVAEDLELGPATAAIIGRGGSNVADLEKRHGVKINVRSEIRTARVVGKPGNVSAAIEEMLKVVTPILEAEKLQKKAQEAVESGESAWQQPDDQVDDADGW